ncbi:MAG: NfeD family protein [Rickettsiales bacterium]
MESLSPTEIWLIAGVLMLVAEALGVSGVGLLFAGLGALSLGALLEWEYVALDDTLMQFIYFLAFTAAWTLVLWKPMRRFYSNRSGTGYKNMVGDIAYVGEAGLTKNQPGEVTWSGTIMKAMLADELETQKLDAGVAVEIVRVHGTTLIVKPKA